MNRKGFAVTGIIYTLMIVFIILIITLLAMFSDRKNLLDELKERVLNEVNTYEKALNMVYSPKSAADANTDPYYEYIVKVKGYYNFYVTSADGTNVKTSFYLREGEKVYIKVGSKTYNSGKTEIAFNNTTNNVLVVQNNSRYTINSYEDRVFIGSKLDRDTSITEGKVEIEYASNKRQNTDLNRTRYIRECLYSNSANGVNEWSEIKAIKSGINYALSGTVSGDVINPEVINDDNIHNLTQSTLASDNKACVVIDLGAMYDVDYIYIWHNYSDNRIYYEREVAVSSDNENYRFLDNYEVSETEQGNSISAYEKPKVIMLGSVAFPIKKKEGKTWIRLFHHNNRGGTILWDAREQVLKSDGYKAPYKISGLAFIKNFARNNSYYELMIEYPELNKEYIWTQSNDFTTEDTPGTYLGLHGISDSRFSGLQKSSSNDTTISSTNSRYHIGAIHSTEGGIMGPNQVITEIVDLWVRAN